MGSLAACALQVQEQETDESKCKYKRLIGKKKWYLCKKKKKARKGPCGADDGDVRDEILSSTKESEKNNKSN